MKRGRNKLTYVGMAVFFPAIILLQLLLNKSIFQFIILLLLMFLAVAILVKVLPLTGMPEIVAGVGIPAIPILSKCLGETPLAGYMSDFYNLVIMKSCDVIGLSFTRQIGRDTSITITFWLLFLAVLLMCNRDCTAMKILKGSTCEELKKADYISGNERFCKFLRSRLTSVNEEYCWDEKYFTPIEAEVDVCIKGKQKKRFDDLLKCLKSIKHRGTVFLVLGNPGTGKSVALRKLCLELLDESNSTKKIPVYINLKKWNRNWNLDYLPDRDELIAFIKKTLRENGDQFTKAFLDKYFDLMLEDGRWYFVFDSFDELPCFMGKRNCQELIDKLSHMLYEFMTDTAQNGGIVASRFYKATSESIGAAVTLRIQEFSDIKIKIMLQKYLRNMAKGVVRELFGKHENLVSLCRNPFYLNLLINYLNNNDMLFPQNQMELYECFVESRLKKCSDRMESKGITAENVHRAAKELAVLMQSSPSFGLECPVAVLQRQNGQGLQKELELLEAAKICRFGVGNRTISFIHRRFQEFFLVEHIMEQGDDIVYEDYRSIISNSGIRDALVLYCEVAEERKAREIAEFCQDVIRKNIKFTQNILKTESMELVNTLYFMVEAFRNRGSAIKNFVAEFEELVMQALDTDTDFVILLALSNSMVLFQQRTLPQMVLSVFCLPYRWLSDVVMQNCRTLRRLDYRIETEFCKYFAGMNIKTFLKRFRNIRFSLSLSRSFRYIRKIHFIFFKIESSVIVSLFLLLMFFCCGKSFLVTPEWIGQSSFLRSSVEPFYKMMMDFISNTSIVEFFALSILSLMIPVFYSNYFILVIWVLFVFGQIMLLLFCDVLSSPKEVGLIGILLFFMTLLHIFLMACNIFDLCVRVIIHNICAEAKNKFQAILLLSAYVCIYLMFGFIFLIRPIPQDVISLPACLDTFLWVGKVLGEVILGILFYVILIYLSVSGIRTFIHYLQDIFWLKGQPDLRTMTREKLAHDLECLHGDKRKRKYIEELLYKKVELTGKWPDDRRPKQMDDQLVYNLAKLDCLRLENDNYLF